jgi:hypothetical protein
MEVLLTVRTGARPSDPTLKQLRRLHLLTRVTGIRDFETGALLAGLAQAGDEKLGRKLSEEYTRRRRKRLPLHSVLAAAQRALA